MTEAEKRQFRDHLAEWDLTRDELNEIIAENPPVISVLSGFVTEYKFRKLWLGRRGISNVTRPLAADRATKCDFVFQYLDRQFSVEVKSLDRPKVQQEGDGWKGTFQCNASDSREVELPNGDKVVTNCLVVGQFDVLAVGLFSFGSQWRFAFARNDDLPRSRWKNYTEVQRKFLLPSSMRITWPLQPPYSADLFGVLDSILRKR